MSDKGPGFGNGRPVSVQVNHSTKTGSARAAIMRSGGFDTKLREANFAVWTINDQQRLLALDALHDRMLSYHNNIHVKESKLDNQPTDSIVGNEENILGTACVAVAVTFSSANENPRQLSFNELQDYIRDLNAKAKSAQPSNEFTWIHLREALVVDSIASELGMHELIVNGFQDFRAHSNMLPGNSELFLSMVTSVLEANDCNMYKLFVYVNSFVVITFQAELLPDLSSSDVPNPDLIVESLINNHASLRSKCLSLGPIYLVYELSLRTLRMSDSSLEFISCALSYFNRIVHLNLLHRERLDLRIKMDMIASGVLLMKRSVDEVKGLCNTLLQLAMDYSDPMVGHTAFAMNPAQASSTDVASSNLANTYGAQQSSNTHVSAADTATLQAAASMTNTHNVDANISFSNSVLFNNQRFKPNSTTYMKKYHKYNLATLDHNSYLSHSQLRRILYGDLIDIRHIPYLLELCDAYSYIHTCLHTEFEETVRLQAELDGTIQLRTSNTSLVLSLIATIFLPLTFLAGVFGMNFTENGGYSIEMLNYSHGPTIFAFMCVACFIVIFSFFVYQGWIEFGLFAKLYRSIHHTDTNIDDSAKTVANPRAAQRANAEEQRRREQTQFVRQSMAMAARGFSTRRSTTSNASGYPSSVGMPNGSFAPVSSAPQSGSILQSQAKHPRSASMPISTPTSARSSGANRSSQIDTSSPLQSIGEEPHDSL